MRASFSRFGSDRRGSVAIMFGLVAVVLAGAVGVALDYSRAANVQTSLQRALDGVALLAAKNNEQMGAAPMTDAAATEFVRENFPTARIESMQVRLTFLSDRVRADGSAVVPTTVSNVLGLRQVPVSGVSEALFGDTKAEIVLVLDNTGSMRDSGKLDTLKGAANTFLDRMQASITGPGALRIGIVPFGDVVNLGALKDSSWVDPNQTSAWRTNPATAGCIWDREQPYDANDATPSAALPGTMFGADPNASRSCDRTPIQPLTSDFALLRSTINAMTASGTTNLTIGLVWGLHMLTPSEPLTGALPSTTRSLTKYVILFTDGQNTRNRFTNDPTAIDGRTRAVCDQLRSQGVQVYTGRIIDGNESLLQNCATSPTMYYPVDTVDQLKPVFDRIYASIMGTRIAR